MLQSIVLFTAGDREDSTFIKIDEGRQRVKRKQSIRFSPGLLLCCPTKSSSTSLPPLPTEEEKTRSPSLKRAAAGGSSFPGPLSLSFDGLRLFTAGSSRHKSSTGTARQQRLCAVSSAPALLLYKNTGRGKRHVAILFHFNFWSTFFLLYLCFSLPIGTCLRFVDFLVHQSQYTQPIDVPILK